MQLISIIDNLHKFHKLVPEVDKNHREQAGQLILSILFQSTTGLLFHSIHQ